MGLIRWRDEYATEVESIDNDHKKLVELINQLYEARRQGEADQLLKRLFAELNAYCNEHFKREEDEMERLGYPEREAHQQEHQQLMQQTATLQSQLESGEDSLSNETFKFLRHWLLDHIVEVDKKFGAYSLTKTDS